MSFSRVCLTHEFLSAYQAYPGPKSQVKSTLDKFVQWEGSRGLRLENIENDYFTIRVNKKIRIEIIKIDGFWLCYDIMLDHNYTKGVTQYRNNQAGLISAYRPHLPHWRYEPSQPLDTWKPISDDLMVVESEMEEGEKCVTAGCGAGGHDLVNKCATPLEFYGQDILAPSVQQFELMHVSMPAAISGVAGSGKTFVAFSVLSSLADSAIEQSMLEPLVEEAGAAALQPVLYLAKSEKLVESLRKAWLASPYAHHEHVIFMTIESLAKRIYPDKTALPNRQKSEYFEALRDSTRRSAHTRKKVTLWDKYTISQVIEELKLMSHYGESDDDSDYCALGERASNIDPEYRQEMYILYQGYQGWLRSHDYYDLDCFSQTEITETFSGVVLDEAQDVDTGWFSFISNILTRLNQCLFLCDNKQDLTQQNVAVESVFKRMLGKANVYYLKETYRCAQAIQRLANNVLSIKYETLEGDIDKEGESYIETRSSLPGNVYQFNSTDAFFAKSPHFLESPSPDLVVLVASKLQQKNYVERYPGVIILTIEEAKGREYQTIVLDGLEELGAIEDIAKLIKVSDGAGAGAAARAKKSAHKMDKRHRHGAFFGMAFTAITRASENCVMCMSFRGKHPKLLAFEKRLYEGLSLREDVLRHDEQTEESLINSWVRRHAEFMSAGDIVNANMVWHRYLEGKVTPEEVGRVPVSSSRIVEDVLTTSTMSPKTKKQVEEEKKEDDESPSTITLTLEDIQKSATKAIQKNRKLEKLKKEVCKLGSAKGCPSSVNEKIDDLPVVTINAILDPNHALYFWKLYSLGRGYQKLAVKLFSRWTQCSYEGFEKSIKYLQRLALSVLLKSEFITEDALLQKVFDGEDITFMEVFCSVSIDFCEHYEPSGCETETEIQSHFLSFLKIFSSFDTLQRLLNSNLVFKGHLKRIQDDVLPISLFVSLITGITHCSKLSDAGKSEIFQSLMEQMKALLKLHTLAQSLNKGDEPSLLLFQFMLTTPCCIDFLERVVIEDATVGETFAQLLMSESLSTDALFSQAKLKSRPHATTFDYACMHENLHTFLSNVSNMPSAGAMFLDFLVPARLMSDIWYTPDDGSSAVAFNSLVKLANTPSGAYFLIKQQDNTHFLDRVDLVEFATKIDPDSGETLISKLYQSEMLCYPGGRAFLNKVINGLTRIASERISSADIFSNVAMPLLKLLEIPDVDVEQLIAIFDPSYLKHFFEYLIISGDATKQVAFEIVSANEAFLLSLPDNYFLQPLTYHNGCPLQMNQFQAMTLTINGIKAMHHLLKSYPRFFGVTSVRELLLSEYVIGSDEPPSVLYVKTNLLTYLLSTIQGKMLLISILNFYEGELGADDAFIKALFHQAQVGKLSYAPICALIEDNPVNIRLLDTMLKPHLTLDGLITRNRHQVVLQLSFTDKRMVDLVTREQLRVCSSNQIPKAISRLLLVPKPVTTPDMNLDVESLCLLVSREALLAPAVSTVCQVTYQDVARDTFFASASNGATAVVTEGDDAEESKKLDAV